MAQELDILCPKGAVEVHCCHPDCGTAWWVEPLDPRLPGPFDCGADHSLQKTLDRTFALLRARHGFAWGSLGNLDQNDDRDPPVRGYAVFHDRLHLKAGLLLWESPKEFGYPDEMAFRIQWEQEHWPARLQEEEQGFSHLDMPSSSPGTVRAVPYHLLSGEKRRYTFVRCTTCHHLVMVDADDPTFQPERYSHSGGGGEIPTPPWMDRTFYCGQGLKTLGGVQPCSIVYGAALAEFEATSGCRWTIWSNEGAPRSVLFFNPKTEQYGLLYRDLDTFRSAESIGRAILWGSLRDAAENLKRNGGKHDDVALCLSYILQALPA